MSDNSKGGENLSVEIRKLDVCPAKNPNLLVKFTEMGNIIEVQYMTRRNNKATIRMLEGGEEYIELSTGEVKPVIHHETRADQKKSLYRTFKTVRGLINANVVDVNNVRWITLTYAENMTDAKRLYIDFKQFNQRFQYYINKLGYDKAEYIVMCEPQGRGAWHCHLLYIFDVVAPFISNDIIFGLWKHGYTKIKKLDDVDNVGAYLTAYLGDMEVLEAIDNQLVVCGQKSKIVDVDVDGKKEKKYFIKGARLKLYPVNFNMYRCSRGIKRPEETFVTQKYAEQKVSAGTLTFEKTVALVDSGSGFESVINTKQYNMKRKKNQFV